MSRVSTQVRLLYLLMDGGEIPTKHHYCPTLYLDRHSHPVRRPASLWTLIFNFWICLYDLLLPIVVHVTHHCQWKVCMHVYILLVASLLGTPAP